MNILGNERCVVFLIHELVFFTFIERSNELNQSQKKKNQNMKYSLF